MADRTRSSRQLNTRRGRMNDAGFSLVELLIAVTILAIIVIPLLHMFVTSTRINVKSRQTLRATTVAQDIMEGLKAYTLEDVQKQFSLPDGTPSSTFFYPSEGFYIVNSKMIQGGVREITELEKNRDAKGNVIYSEDPSDPDANLDNEIYYFGIQNLKMQGGEYDALIKLDASTYTKDKVKGVVGGSGPSADAHDNYFNGAYYADVTSVSETSGSSKTDSSYHEDPNLSANALKDIKKQIENDAADPTKGITLPDDWDEITEWKFSGGADKIVLTKREINVELDVTKNEFNTPIKDEEGNFQCTATITIEYTCKFGGEEYTSYGDGALGSGKVFNIPRTFTSGNFYLFYYPIYAPGKNPIDQITFNMHDASTLLSADEPVLKSITLAKQIRSTVDTTYNTIEPEMTDDKLRQSEDDYGAYVEVTWDSAMMNVLTFRTNIDTNMAESAKYKGPDGHVYWGDLDGVTKILTSSNITELPLTGETVDGKVTNVIYDIEITVYKAGAAQYFGEADFENRDDVVRLAKITNLNS